MTRIAIISDAWFPQVNGVVRTLDTVRRELTAQQHEILVIGPDRFRTIPCPTYPQIRLAVMPEAKLTRLIDEFQPQSLHIATEGPLGMAARRLCLRRGYHFTTSYHTRFPEYVRARVRLPLSLSYGVMRRFHGPAERVLVATQSIEDELKHWGFRNIVRWGRGVDTDLFRPHDATEAPAAMAGLARPILLNIGRVAVEKNIEAFLGLDLPGTKVVVGDGPQLAELKRRFPATHFLGEKSGAELARHYAAADVFVFPSRTDTFGLVLLEALASGVPVAAFPVPGPNDVIADHPVGWLDQDLGVAVRGALTRDRQACRDHALRFSWAASARQFLDNLAPLQSANSDAEAEAPVAA